MASNYIFIDDQRVPIIAYDVTIADLSARRKNAIEFKTLKIAEQKLGVGQNVLKNAIRKKGRVFSTLYQKEFAIRFKKENK
jgi:predicted transglutaminase-like protease